MTFSRKIGISILSAGLSVFVLVSCTPDSAGNQAGHQNIAVTVDAMIGAIVFVDPANGLNLREGYSSAAERIKALPQHTRLTVLERSPQTETIGGLENHWFRVDDGTDIGWVFGAFLTSDLPPPHLIPNTPMLITDFTTAGGPPPEIMMMQVGDLVIRDGELMVYTGYWEPHIEIPGDLGITSINRDAFAHNSSIVSIRIPAGVTSIRHEWGVFPNAVNLESIIVAPDNEYYVSVDGGLFNRDLTEIIHIPDAKATPLVIPASITRLESRHFRRPDRVPSLSIPASVTAIEQDVFSNWGGWNSLVSITVDPDNAFFASHDGVLFNRNMTAIIHVPRAKEGPFVIPASVQNIAERQFMGRNLSSVVIPQGVTSIPNQAFQGARNLAAVVIPSSVTHIGNNAFLDSGLTSVTLPAGLTHIGQGAFGNASFTSITIPPGVTHIGNNAFMHTGLTSVTIPASVTNIGNNAFAGSADLTSITVEMGNRHFVSQEGVLFDRDMTSIVYFPNARAGSFAIPAGITSIGWAQFGGRAGLTSIVIPASVTSIGNSTFDNSTSLTSITVDPDSEHFASVDGVLFSRDMTRLVRFPEGRGGTYSIPDTVTEIAGSAFSGTSGLTGVYIPDSVTSIGHSAFAGSGLVSVFIPDSVTSLGWGIFSGASDLVSIILPEGLSLPIASGEDGKGGGEDFFWELDRLEQIIVGENHRYYRSIDGVLFSRDGTTLVRFPQGRRGGFTIPDGVTSIGYKAFYNAAGLTSVIISASVTSIADFAFDGASSLISVSIPEGVANIGRFAFARAASLISVSIPASVNSIGDFVFYACVNLRHVSVDENSSSFTLSNGIIFNRGMTEIAQILPNAAWQHHLLAEIDAERF